MRTLLLFITLTSFCFAQTEDPLKYFPYKTGNMWEYYFSDSEYPDTVQVFNIKDSVDAEGNIYVTQFAKRIKPIQEPLLFPDTSVYMIDTSFNVFGIYSQFGAGSESLLIYKLNAKQDDQWVVYEYPGGNGYEITRLINVREDELFGVNTIHKAYVYYYSQDSTDTLGLVRYADVLAYGFGIRTRGGGDFIGDVFLKGCVINDTLYGDTTNIITSIMDLSENHSSQFELSQNFPNPFNPSTEIKYTIKNTGFVSLKVYDLLGKEIAVLVNEEKPTGSYTVSFNGSDLSSGVYFYVLKAGDFVESRKMVLLK